MFKLSFLFAALYANICFSIISIPKGEIISLDATYSSPSGSGYAELIDIENELFVENTKLEVENYNGMLIFTAGNESLELNLSDIISEEIEDVNIVDLNLLNDNENFDLRFNTFSATTPQIDVKSNDLEFKCDRTGSLDVYNFLKDCLTNLNFNLDHLTYKNVDNEITTVDRLDINISDKKITLTTISSATKNLKLVLKGKVDFLNQENLIKIKVDSARVAGLNVKGMIFDKLDEIDFIEVDEPYFYIGLRD